MITRVYGDLFYSPARVLVNPVNIMGTMGAGLAADFKWFFPEMFEAYRDLCQTDRFTIGQLMLYKTPGRWILNFPTKRHWRADSTLEYITEGLKTFARVYADYGITSVSFPLLGTGKGNLATDDVLALMEGYLDPLPIPVYIHLVDTADDNGQTPPPKSRRVLRHWLNGQPVYITFERFWQDMLTLVRDRRDFQTHPDNQGFRVVATDSDGRQRLSLKLSPRRGDSVFLPETQLRDLWQYVRRAGYVLPRNLPNGLNSHAAFLVALLSELPFIRRIQLATPGSDPVTGLHVIPPVRQHDDDIQTVHLEEISPVD
jgi:O-acetyl-ADP-ribose deacetylase (regulator of RNase III)